MTKQARTDWRTLTKEQKLEAVKPLLMEKLTASGIAERFTGATKGAIIGFCGRNKLQLPYAAKPPATQRLPVSKQKVGYQIHESVMAQRLYTPTQKSKYDMARLPGVHMMDLTGCKFALTDEPPFMFCDAPRLPGESYCSHHHDRCYPPNAGTPSEKRALKDAGRLVKDGKVGYVQV